MIRVHRGARVVLTFAAVTALASQLVARQPAPDREQQVAALKASLQAGHAKLRKYDWVETTFINFKGEENARKQQRCYYGADGKVQKVPIGGEPAPQQEQSRGRGRRGGALKDKVVENKKDDMKEYMEKAAALVHTYVPPDPADIDRVKKAGTLAVKPGAAGQMRLEFTNYHKPADMLAIGLNAAAGQLTDLSVSSYLDDKEDVVRFGVTFGALADGASYAAETTLDAPAKHIKVVIQNTGHRPVQ